MNRKTDLEVFITTKMRMSHIYQPVMIKTILVNGGTASQEQIAQAILSYDSSQVEYYTSITNRMVGRVLRDHSVVEKNGKEYHLSSYESLTQNAINDLIALCDSKIEEHLEQRGQKVFEHRRRNRRPVPGSIRYKVLSRAKYRCELCGISAEEKALEVDHITPKSLGGEDSINNYQALCFTCNANKGNTDDADFRRFKSEYYERMKGCLFCELNRKAVFENNLAIAIRDAYPVTPGHTLIIPRRHVDSYFNLHQAEVNAIHQLTERVRNHLLESDSTVSSFNIGINAGADAGQTIEHCHLHLIPRRSGDVADPVGGVRNIIPGRGNYIADR